MGRSLVGSLLGRQKGLTAALGLIAIIGLITAAPTFAAAPISWVEQTPATSPTPTQSALMTYDSQLGELVLFGGAKANSEFDRETWTYNGTEWTKRSPATSPTTLLPEAASMTYDAALGKVVLVVAAESSDELSEQTWTYDGSEWVKQAPATSPPPYLGASMAYDAALGKVVLFGGATVGAGSSNETWTYDGTNWVKQTPATSPPPRAAAMMSYDPALGKVVLFGGVESGVPLAETWAYDGTEWTEQSDGAGPQPRLYAAMAYDPTVGGLVLFGGLSGAGVLEETWIFHGAVWTEQSPAKSPNASVAGAMDYDPTVGGLVLFGGANGGGTIGGTWTYHPLPLPTATVSSPFAGQSVPVLRPFSTSFSCGEDGGGSPIVSCTDSRGSTTGVGSLDTTYPGPHSYTVTAVAEDGMRGSTSIPYTVHEAASIYAQSSLRSELGGEAGDEAAILYAQAPTGTITFRLYGPGDPTCSAAPVSTWSQAVSGGGPYLTEPFFTPDELGTYRFIASYSGDANNESFTTACGANGQSVSVSKANPTISTEASAGVSLGGQVSDTAKIEGGFSTGGTVTFRAYGPSPGCSGTPAYTSPAVTISGNGSYTSPSFTPTVAGTYHWVASYSGDAGNEAVAGDCGASGESVTVTAPAPTTEPEPTTKPSQNTSPPASGSESTTKTSPATKASPAAPAPSCIVPKLKGKTLAAAKKGLAAAHCKLGKVTSKKGAAGKAAKVASQSPAAGKKAAAGAKVNVKLG